MPDIAAGVPDPADDAVRSAAGLRETARWTAGAFAGIPSLAIIGALVRAPGDAGFQEAYLIAGVLLAAAGALVGILAFAAVFAPAGLVDASIDADVIANLPEARYASYAELRHVLELARDVVGEQRVLASDYAGWADAAKARADACDQLLSTHGPDPDPVDSSDAFAARLEARQLRVEAGAARGRADMRARELALREEILTSLEHLRRAAYGLQAARTVGVAYTRAKRWLVLAIMLVATGVILLALAPKPSAAPSTSSARVSLAGAAALLSAGEEHTTVLCDGPCRSPRVA